MFVKEKKTEKFHMAGIEGGGVGKWWYVDLAEERVSHCLCGPSLGDRASLTVKENIIKSVPKSVLGLFLPPLPQKKVYSRGKSQSGYFIWLEKYLTYKHFMALCTVVSNTRVIQFG